ncbi:transporter [Lysobacter sp. TY2-98]|nr:transporter [Lysobacter sp. TY2-98]
MFALAAFFAHTARAQDIEPRAYSNAPVGVNFVIVGNVLARGGMSFDPSVPLDDAHIETNSIVLAYARALDLWGRSGKFDAIVPYSRIDGTALFAGQPVSRDIHGFARPAFRVSMNLYGAPALQAREFRGWKQDLIVGMSLQVAPPLGQYDATRLVNVSSHRWSVKPEIGVSKAVGRWTIEVQAAATLYGDNGHFFGNTTRSQDPIYALQGHLIYGFVSGKWVSFDATWFTGGRTRIDGALNNDLQRNTRVGIVFALPVNPRNSVKLTASSGVVTRTGSDFDAVGIAWQYRWGGGL